MSKALTFLAAALAALVLAACARDGARTPSELDAVAQAYVKLVLAVGEHDDGYVDAYYGPDEWREEAVAATADLETLRAETDSLIRAAQEAQIPSGDIWRLRRQYLVKQLDAVGARIDMLNGETLSFDEETLRLYDVIAPDVELSDFDETLAAIDALMPGAGPLAERVNAFRARFIIPPELLSDVFDAAIEECRIRTIGRINLPSNERFTLEYVTDKSWSGYNWYQGNSVSLIQINTDLPIYLDRAVDLGCHEGYPGHHTYNALLEKHLARDRGWVEFSVYPLYSPQSVIAEGTANLGIDMAFPGEERLAFERDVLMPLAGLEGQDIDSYHALRQLMRELSFAGNEIARDYLDGRISRDEAVELYQRYVLMSPERAAQRVRFVETYRGYVVNYNLGQRMAREHVERAGDDHFARWRSFEAIMSTPTLPSDL